MFELGPGKHGFCMFFVPFKISFLIRIISKVVEDIFAVVLYINVAIFSRRKGISQICPSIASFDMYCKRELLILNCIVI